VTRYLKQARRLAGALAVVVGLTLVAPPAFAAVPAPASHPITAAATAKVAALPAASLAQAAPAAAPPASADKPFFKTPKGVVALVLTAGATAWLIQSRNSNKVTSPGRQ
jgi:hypothetical protein